MEPATSETFLTPAELRRLTDKVYAPAQRRVLDARKIPYELDGRSRPVVLRAVIERRQLGRAVSTEPVHGPDFSAFPAV
jgi:hypothetical protein